MKQDNAGFRANLRRDGDARTGSAARHGLHKMLMTALLCVKLRGRTCAGTELSGRSKEEFLRRFMRLERGVPSRGAFSALFRILDPDCLGRALVRPMAFG